MKRVTVGSAGELAAWLTRNDDQEGPVMLVTHADRASSKYISRAAVQAALEAQGWVSTRRYTLSKALVGHIVHR